MKRGLLLLGVVMLAGSLCSGMAKAADTAADTKKTSSGIKIVPTGRALFDAAAYEPADSDFRAGVTCPDVRLGAKANFGNFEARADISLRFGKFYPADIYLQYNITPSSFIKGGFFVHQFGLQSATGASTKIGMEEPVAQSAFGELRLLGAMYVWSNAKLHFAGSLFGDPALMTAHSNEASVSGYGALARFAWHPRTAEGDIFQLGVSALGRSVSYGAGVNHIYNFKAPYPTKVANVTAAIAKVDSVNSIWKLSPEILWSRGRVAAEGQLYYLNAPRSGALRAYQAWGGYAQARILLNRNAHYGYSSSTAYLTTPPAKSWEIVAGYSGMTLNDSRAAITGGRVHTGSLTLNYYIHKYVTWRLNYTFAHTSGGAAPVRNQNIFQTRIQFLF